MTDPIADYLTRLRNAIQAKHRIVEVPASNLKKEITKILFEKGYILNYKFVEDGPQGTIKIALKYDNVNKVYISGLDASISTRWANGLGGKVAYTYTRESVPNGEPLVTSTRPHMASLRIDYDRQWQLYGINASLTGKFFSATDAGEYTANTGFKEVETIHYSAYMMWKLIINQRICNAISVTATIDNLFNYIPEYFHTSSPATIGRTYSIGISMDIEELPFLDFFFVMRALSKK